VTVDFSVESNHVVVAAVLVDGCLFYMSEGHIRASVERRNSKETEEKKSGGWMDGRHLKGKSNLGEGS
jgi:hypothetical protein